ncbi:MAG: hypothetical protein ACPLRS_03155 [Hydrogenobacter sp.]
MRILLLDMETTGLVPELDDVWNIAWLVIKNNKVVKVRNCYYPIKRFGQDYWGFRFAYTEKNGLIYPMKYKPNRSYHWTEDKDLIEDIRKADILVAHNISFELGFLRFVAKEVENKAQFCTMRASTRICGIPRVVYDYYEDAWIRVGYKWTKLEEAYNYLVKDKRLERYLGDWHTAVYDLFATLRVYERLTGTRIEVPFWIWLKAGLLKGYLRELKSKIESKAKKIKLTLKREEIPF